jgi:hypothetical protein
MKARWFLALSAVLAWLFAAMLLFNARKFEAPIGIDVTDKVATIAQAQGAILLGLGVINWMARSIADDGALTAILAGNLVVQLASLGVAARALVLGIFPMSAAPAVVIHVLLGAGFAFYLMRVHMPRRAAISS